MVKERAYKKKKADEEAAAEE